MLRAAMDNGLVSASVYEQAWSDVGTPERLAEINKGATPLKDAV
jgi:MurNAc alpha-1-phosphate uridylyltransferase